MPEEKKDKESSRLKPTEYEAENIFLERAIKTEVMDEFDELSDDVVIAGIVLIVVSEDEPVSPVILTHESPEEAEGGVVKIKCENPEKAEEIVEILEYLTEEENENE